MTNEQVTMRLSDGEEIVRFDSLPSEGPTVPVDPREAALQLRRPYGSDRSPSRPDH